MTSKIAKTLARQKEKIDEGSYYEAHQQLRVISARYVKAQDYTSAIDVLASGAALLLRAGQGGSGGDLCMLLLDVYGKAELASDAASRGRLLGLMRAFPAGEPTRRRFITEAVGWSAKFGEYPAGDPEVHHVAGQLYAEDFEPYDAERHLALGTKDSPQELARLEYEWYADDDDISTAGTYAARAVFPFLLVGNLRAANQALLLFLSRLGQAGSSLAVQEVSGSTSDVRVYPGVPLLNFLSLLLLAVERGTSDLFKTLKSHYASYIREQNGWDEALEQVAEMYFGIRKPRQGNPLFDMMGSMFGGGGGGGGSRSSPKPKQGKIETPAPAPTLD